jgi:hypothetical protein
MSVFELSALPKLRRVGLVRVNQLTDEAIYALAERHATLERIHLSYCDQISVMAIHFLLLKLHKLTHLSLTGVPAFRQPELQRFCREAPKVRISPMGVVCSLLHYFTCLGFQYCPETCILRILRKRSLSAEDIPY